MAERSPDIVLRVVLTGTGESDVRVLTRLLEHAESVTAFELSEDGRLTVSLHPEEGETQLARLLAVAGIFPHHASELGTNPELGGPRAC
jgi:hypothetical protein